MPTYRRKQTAPIEAIQFEGEMTPEVSEFLGEEFTDGLPPENGKHCWDEPTMTLRMWNSEERQHIKVPSGHWIIKGLRGEYYPCSDEVFQQSYEPVPATGEVLPIPEDAATATVIAASSENDG